MFRRSVGHITAGLRHCYRRFKYFSNDTDCFAHILYLCHCLALDGHRDLRLLVVLAILSVPMIFFGYQISQGDSLLGIRYYVISMMFLMITLFKMAIVRVTFRETQTLMNYINAHVFHRDDPYCYKLRRKTYFITWKILFAFGSYLTTFVVVYMGTTHPTSVYIGFQPEEVTWYHVIFVSVLGLCQMLHHCIYLTSILMVSFLMHWFHTELEIVANAFSRVFHEKPPFALRKGVNNRRGFLQREDIRWTGINRRMVYCTGRHAEIVKLIKMLRKIVEPIFFGLGFYIVTAISSLIFVINNDRFFNFLAFSHTASVITEFYYYAHLVDDLDDQNHLIANAIYDQGWPMQLKHSSHFAKYYKSVRTMILIVIMQSHHPFRFTCGGMYKMTVPVFTAMIETLYVAVTFMLRTIKIQR